MNSGAAAMTQYEDVNREIQNFLASKGATSNSPDITPTTHHLQPTENEKLPDILPLLQSLLSTYSEINRHLETGHADGLKDTLLKSDIKMNLVCETLLETLRRTTEEKNRLSNSNNELMQNLRKMQEEEAVSRVKKERLESDLELRKREVDELTRVSRDQKTRCEESWKEVQKAKSDCALLRIRVDELENLKMRASERIAVHEKEVSALSKLICEKDEEIRRIAAEKTEEEGKNSGAKMRVVELERCVEVLTKKLETKEKSLTLCNNELSKLLFENKSIKQEFEKHQENCGYYEKLYKSLDKQNAYLNSKLNNLLRSTDKEGLERIEYYRKKAKRSRRRLRKMKEKMGRLKEELSTVRDSSLVDGSDTLIKRIDELTEKNREYRSRVQALETEKRGIERKIEELESQRRESLLQRRQLDKIKETKTNNNLRYTSNDINRPHGDSNRPYDESYKPFSHPVYNDTVRPYNQISYKPNISIDREFYNTPTKDNTNPHRYLPVDKNVDGLFKNYTPSLQHDYSLKQEQSNNFNTQQRSREDRPIEEIKPSRMFNLEHTYEDKPQIEVGGYVEEIPEIESAYKQAFEPVRSTAERVKRNSQKNATRQSTGGRSTNTVNTQVGNQQVMDEPSVDSVKTYHTTSTLKDMMARTDKLQKKFEALEEQLANIKEDDTAERLSERVNTYSNNLSNWNVDSADSDFI